MRSGQLAKSAKTHKLDEIKHHLSGIRGSQISTKSKFVNLKVEIRQFRLGEKTATTFIYWPSSPSFPPEGGERRKADNLIFTKSKFVNLKVEISQFRLGEKTATTLIIDHPPYPFPPEGGKVERGQSIVLFFLKKAITIKSNMYLQILADQHMYG